ncbi:MAG: TRIC cation channel family protein [Coriobacteriia bacterium]|nr:TRIC cation channel family protein [Coriobacteriia bacterium]
MDLVLLGHITSVVLIDYFAVVVGVVMGALFAVKRNLDVIGAIVMALLTGFGGGVIRDTLLHDQGFFFMQHPYLVICCIGAAALVFFGASRLEKLDASLLVADALSVALFALAGVAKAWAAGVGPVYSVLLGTITAVGGGALASIAIAETPRIFKSSDYYAIAGGCGALAYCLCAMAQAPELICSLACVATCLALRAASLKLDLRTRSANDVPKH